MLLQLNKKNYSRIYLYKLYKIIGSCQEGFTVNI